MDHSFQKCKLTCGDRTQTGGCLGRGAGPSGEMTKEQEERCGGRGGGGRGDDEYFHYLDCGDGAMNVYTCQNLSSCHFNYLFEHVTLNMFRLSCVLDFTTPLKIATAMDELTGKSKSPAPGARGSQPELEVRKGNGRESRCCHRDSVSRRRGVAPPVTDLPAGLEMVIKRATCRLLGSLTRREAALGEVWEVPGWEWRELYSHSLGVEPEGGSARRVCSA